MSIPATNNKTNNVALVFGASGTSGWAVVRNLLFFPDSTTFARVIALTHRPRTIKSSGLPWNPRIELYAFVDLQGNLDQVVERRRSQIADLDDITHVYYCAYSNATAYTENVMDIKAINVRMTYNAVHAVDKLCSGLKFLFCREERMYHYGVAMFLHMDKISINPPLEEDAPRIPFPYGDEIFYYDQVDIVRAVSKDKSWGFTEVRPDQILGFVPNVSGMTYVEPIALYLCLYRYVHGADSEVPFPGTFKNYVYTSTDTSQNVLSKAEIYLSIMTPDSANEQAFNVADTSDSGSWSRKWPILTEYFGLKGAAPQEDAWSELEIWWEEHQTEYFAMCHEYGLHVRRILHECWIFVKAGFTLLDRSRVISLDKIRGVGFTEELAVGEGHRVVFDRLREAMFIPTFV